VKDVTGKKINMLTFLKEDVKWNKQKKNKYYKKWMCKCDCGIIKSIGVAHVMRGQIKSCGCLHKRINSDNPLFTGVGEISSAFWLRGVMRTKFASAKRRTIGVSITIEEAWNLFLEQKRRCALTGLELKFPESGKDKNWTASLDRIDSSKPYEIGNIQWVHKHINVMKNKYSQEYFIEMCKLISNMHK